MQTQNTEHAENPMTQSTQSTKSSDLHPDRSGYDGHDHDFDDPLGMDIEDFLPDTPEDIDKDAEPKTFSK